MITRTVSNGSLSQTKDRLLEYISASRLSLWMKCPLAFKYRYVDGIRTPPNANLFLGKVVHAALEVYYRHRQIGMTLSVEAMDRHLSRVWNDCLQREPIELASSENESALKNQAASLIHAYLENLPPDEPKTLGAETPLETDLIDPASGENLGIPLMGIVDLVQDSPNGPAIIDFKTAARASAPSPLAHEIQLTAYSYLFRQATGLRESQIEIRQLIKTKTPKIAIHIFPPRTDEHFERFFAVVREYLAAIQRRRFNYRPSWNCGMCEFAGRCCG
jgi:putative RecB family exonuclease